jgi:acetyltransferase
MLRVDTLRDLFDAAETLSSGLHVFGDRLTILTNGGGLGVLAADALELSRGRLTQLSPETRRRLDAVLPTSWSHANPVDILGDAQGDRYRAALDILTDPQASDALLVMNCPTGVGDSMDAARTVVDAVKAHPGRPVIGCWMGEATTTAPRALLSQSGIPNYETPDEAVSAFLHLAEYSRNQRSLFETPVRDLKSAPNRRADAARIISAAILEGREMLTEPEAKAVLSAYNIPVVTTRVVGTPAEAGAAAAAMDGRVALKILSRQISHKTDVGGVRLDLQGETDTRIAAEDLLGRVSAAMPDATIDGFTVQQMIRRPNAQELLLGAVLDPTFGPCLMFGQGGIAAEVIADRCMGLPPLNANLAQDMIGRTRVARLLAGYRDRPPANQGAIEAALVALSDLVVDFPEVAELDINPLLADAQGVIALDARIVVRKPQSAASRLAIRPYPSELAHNVVVDGLSLGLRPIRPEDSRLLLAMAKRTAPDDLRLRFHGGGGVISEASAARLSQIDYDREMVFLAEMAPGDVGGVVRLAFTSGFDTAECAIIVRTDLQNRRIGRTLLGEALAYAASRETQTVWGDVMNGNSVALGLGRKLGGVLSPSPIDGGLTRIVFTLGPGLPMPGHP